MKLRGAPFRVAFLLAIRAALASYSLRESESTTLDFDSAPLCPACVLGMTRRVGMTQRSGAEPARSAVAPVPQYHPAPQYQPAPQYYSGGPHGAYVQPPYGYDRDPGRPRLDPEETQKSVIAEVILSL